MNFGGSLAREHYASPGLPFWRFEIHEHPDPAAFNDWSAQVKGESFFWVTLFDAACAYARELAAARDEDGLALLEHPYTQLVQLIRETGDSEDQRRHAEVWLLLRENRTRLGFASVADPWPESAA